MSRKLKVAALAQLLAALILAQPGRAFIDGCSLPPGEELDRYCDDPNVFPEGGFWAWEVSGYQCQLDGNYYWQQDWYESSGALTQGAAESEASEAYEACEEFGNRP